jgi:hypothetical protein
MRWGTRRNAHIDRTACPWLIRRFIDPAAEFAFVPAGTDPANVDGIAFDMRGATLSHDQGRCTFETFLRTYDLEGDPALVEMGRILREVDVPPTRTCRREAEGIDALIRGFQLTTPDDHEKLRLTAPLYDAYTPTASARWLSSQRATGVRARGYATCNAWTHTWRRMIRPTSLPLTTRLRAKSPSLRPVDAPPCPALLPLCLFATCDPQPVWLKSGINGSNQCYLHSCRTGGRA